MKTTRRHAGRRGGLVLAMGMVVVLAGCGGGDDGGGGAGAAAEPVDASAEGDAAPTAEGAEDAGAEAAAGGPSGTIIIDGTTHEVSGSQREFRMVDGKAQMIEADGDFANCTYQDGGEEGNVAAIVDVDGAELAVFLDSDGAGGYAAYSTVRGQHADPYDAAFADGRVTGTADFASNGGPLIEFDLKCA